MKIIVYLGIAIRILILGLVGGVGYYYSEMLHGFFGDKYDCGSWGCYWQWGGIHYWYSWTVSLLFILSLLNCIISARKLILKYYPNSFEL